MPDETYETIHWTMPMGGSGSVSNIIWNSPGIGETYQVAAVTARYDVGSTGANAGVMVKALGSGVTIGSPGPTAAISQMAGTIGLNAATQITQKGQVIASPTNLTDGSALSLEFSGTLTNLAGFSVAVAIRRVP